MRACYGIALVVLIGWAGVASQASAEPYIVTPGDVLSVTVVGAPEMLEPIPITVRPDGAISFPWVGELEAGGKTVGEIAAALTTALDKRYMAVGVSINLVQSHQRVVFVVGAVANPGTVPVEAETIGVSQAIGAVGGLSLDASQTEARVYPSGQPAVRIDLRQALAQETATTLRPGDVLLIEQRNQISILGEVTKAGLYTIPAEARLSSLLALAGPLTADADPHRAILVDDEGQTTVVDLAFLLNDPDSPINIPATEIRTFVIPPKTDLVVAGAVNAPGTYKLGSQARLVEAITAAGGLDASADPRNVIVVGEDNQARTVDLSEALAHPESDANVSVGSSSLVMVGRRRNAITVLGEVQTTKVVLSDVAVPLSAALAEAGGIGERADTRRVQIIREKGDQEIVDTTALVGQAPAESGAAAPPQDPLLQPGDTVIVARRYARVVVLGAVKAAGTYEFEDGDTAVEAIAQAKGFDKRAVRKATSVLRRDGDTVQVISLNMAAGLRGSEVLLSEPLRDRDIVYVPAKSDPQWKNIVSLLVGAGAIIRVFR